MEIKNVTRSKIPDHTENRLINKTSLFERQINFLKEECQNKNLIMNILLEQRFHTNTHCVKLVQIQGFFWSVFSCIQSDNYGGTKKLTENILSCLCKSD